MPYKDPQKKKEKDREYHRRASEKKVSSDPKQMQKIEFSKEQIQEVASVKGLCEMLAKHILILDDMQLDQVIKSRTISNLSNVMGRILIHSVLEQEVQAMKEQIDALIKTEYRRR